MLCGYATCHPSGIRRLRKKKGDDKEDSVKPCTKGQRDVRGDFVNSNVVVVVF